MDGYVFRTQSEHLFNSIPEALGAVTGEPGDEVHVHIKAAYLAHKLERTLNIRRGVAAADELKHTVAHRLRVHADSVDSVRSQHTQLGGADGIRPAGLDGVFTHSAEVKFILKHRTQPVKLLCGERRRCAAAHVDGHDAQPQGVDLRGSRGDLLFESLQKRRDELHALLNGLAHKAAISTACGAEGDAHIKANILRREGSGGAKSLARSRHAQLRAGRTDVIFPDEAAQGFILVVLLGYQAA